jgi:hypothetical protein
MSSEQRTRINHVHARSWTPTKVESLALALYCINLGECPMLWMRYHSKFYDIKFIEILLSSMMDEFFLGHPTH